MKKTILSIFGTAAIVTGVYVTLPTVSLTPVKQHNTVASDGSSWQITVYKAVNWPVTNFSYLDTNELIHVIHGNSTWDYTAQLLPPYQNTNSVITYSGYMYSITVSNAAGQYTVSARCSVTNDWLLIPYPVAAVFGTNSLTGLTNISETQFSMFQINSLQ